MIMKPKPETETEQQGARPPGIDIDHLDIDHIDTDHLGAREPRTEEPKGAITRLKAKELAKDAQAMIMEGELGGAARSFFNLHIMA
ncbi:unnamed protein product [Cochlearia groenlandica]